MDEIHTKFKQKLENGQAEATWRELGFTDKQVNQLFELCKKVYEGYYGDEGFFSPEYIAAEWAIIDERNKQKQMLVVPTYISNNH